MVTKQAPLLDVKNLSSDDFKSFKALITPAIATEVWLTNTFNRPLSKDRASQYGQDMKAGKWDCNGEPIIFSRDGMLLDGQHRLYACSEFAKVPFETGVTLGIDKETFHTIDTGKKRNGGDILAIESKLTGESIRYRTTVWAAAKIVIEYQRGVIKLKSSRGKTVTSTDCLDFLKENPELQDWVIRSKLHGKWAGGSYAAPLSAVCFIAAKKYQMKAETFMHGVTSGENLSAGSPMLALRKALGLHDRLDRWERISMVIHALNLWVNNKEREHLKLPKGQIPFIVGSEPKWAVQAPEKPKVDKNMKPVRKARINPASKHMNGKAAGVRV